MKTPSKGECHGRHISVPAKVIWLLPEHLTVVGACPWSIRHRDALDVVAIVVVDDAPRIPQRTEDARRVHPSTIVIIVVITIIVFTQSG